MNSYLINGSLAFIEGFALILSPCILPILPIILSGGLTGGKRRPLGIIIGFTLFFALFALLSSTVIQHIGINLDLISKIAYVLIALFGIVLISDRLSNLFSRLTQGIADKSGELADKGQGSGFWSGVLFGGLVSLIWVPCGGPILAAAIVSMAVQKTFLASFITFLCFALGAVLPMIIIVFAGKKIIQKTSFLKKHSHLLRKIFGVIIILFALLLGFTNLSTYLASQSVSVDNASDKDLASDKLIDGLSMTYNAPAFSQNVTWLNTPPLTIEQLRGKVVLIDFWTYSCINCIRTLPYLKDWYQKYHQDGFVIVGVHTPEFEFEKNATNVKNALAQYAITYPVVLDNNYLIWQSYHNQFWPADYLINKDGQVVEQHFGEGAYSETEHNIRVLLGLRGKAAPMAETMVYMPDQTPETYLGYARADNYQGSPDLTAGVSNNYRLPQQLSKDHWALQGEWQIGAQQIQAQSSNTAVKINFFAQHVYAVMGNNNNTPIHVKVFLNGKALPANNITVDRYNLYTLINLPKAERGELLLQFDKPGVDLYTFTFG